MIDMNCSHCGEALHIPDKYRGVTGRCKNCGGVIMAPEKPIPVIASEKPTYHIHHDQSAMSTFLGWMNGLMGGAFSILGCGCLLFILFGLGMFFLAFLSVSMEM